MFEKLIKSIKDFFGEENELVTSTNDAIQERISSPFYGYFLFTWLLTNWKLVYAAFFLNQEEVFIKTGLLRNEYLETLFPKNWEIFLNFVLIPIFLTFLIFWVFPYGTRLFFRKNIKNKKALKIIELQESQKEKKEEKELVQQETALIKEEIEKAKEEKKAAEENPEILWERDFKAFQKLALFRKFKQILDAIYENDGQTKAHYNSLTQSYDFKVDTDILIYSDTNGLISLGQGAGIALTKKGRFFAQRHSELP